jgi:hypothetical protein
MLNVITTNFVIVMTYFLIIIIIIILITIFIIHSYYYYHLSNKGEKQFIINSDYRFPPITMDSVREDCPRTIYKGKKYVIECLININISQRSEKKALQYVSNLKTKIATNPNEFTT